MGAVQGYLDVAAENAYRFPLRGGAFEVAERDGSEVYIVNITCTRVEEEET